MHIKLDGAGKRFNREWIFRRASLDFYSGIPYAITGPNGSGKSTLLQTLGGMLQLSEGTISYTEANNKIKDEALHQQVCLCAPYLDLIEELTLAEFFDFHFSFKQYLPGIDTKTAVAAIGLQAAAHKQIRHFSSGMKQRVKLAQAILCNAAIVLLDEPCSNLDKAGIDLYHTLITRFTTDRLVVVCSNDPVEYAFCKEVLAITDFKPAAKNP